VASLNEYLKKDFGQFMTVDQEHTLTNETTAQSVKVVARLHFDFTACAKFASLYLPSGADVLSIVRHYASDISLALKVADGVLVESGFGRLPKETSSVDLLFTGRLFVYSEDELSEGHRAQIRKFCKEKGIHLVLRSKTYRDERNRYERPLAFISHDSRDKKSVAEPIAIGLQKLSCPVWYDEYALKVGDSLRESIERGIKESNKCILVLSQTDESVVHAGRDYTYRTA